MDVWIQIVVVCIVLLMGVTVYFIREKYLDSGRTIGLKSAFIQIKRVVQGLRQVALFLVEGGRKVLRTVFSPVISLVGWLGDTIRLVVIILVSGVAASLVIAAFIVVFLVDPLLGVGVTGPVLSLAMLALFLSWRQVGSATKPAYGVVTSFGKPVRVVGPGRHWVRPWYRIRKRFPTRQHSFPYEVEVNTFPNKDKGLGRQLIKVQATLYLRWPNPEEKYEVVRGEDLVLISGSDLLMKAFLTVPVDFDDADYVDDLWQHLRGAVKEAVMAQMSSRDYQQCLEERKGIEDGVKELLYAETSNPIPDMGIPSQLLDFSIENVALPDRLVAVLAELEDARRKGEAAEEKAQHEGEAARLQADGQAKAEGARMSAVTRRGGSPTVAAALVMGPELARAFKPQPS